MSQEKANMEKMLQPCLRNVTVKLAMSSVEWNNSSKFSQRTVAYFLQMQLFEFGNGVLCYGMSLCTNIGRPVYGMMSSKQIY